jgi:hypothetical protein
MGPRPQTPQWSIPGVGVLQPCFDRVTIVSSATVGALKVLLPTAALAKASHSFEILTYNGRDPRLQSRIMAVGTHSSNPWAVLAQHARVLARHRITQAEIAFDINAYTLPKARETMFKLVGLLAKPRHQRGHLRTVYKPDETPPPGCVPEPTFYFEDRKAGVKLKCYIRRQKLPARNFGRLRVRIEWTLTGKRALTRYLGGNQIKHLLTADLNAFLKRSIRLEQVNHAALGNLLRGLKHLKKQWKQPEKAAFLILRRLAYRELGKFRDDSQLALLVCQNSPAQIRGYCRELRDGKHRRRRGPKKHKPSSRTPITEPRINRCFDRIQLTPVAHPYNYSCRRQLTPQHRNVFRHLRCIIPCP